MSDMAENIAHGQSTLEGKVATKTESLEKSMKTISEVSLQLDTLQALVVNALKATSKGKLKP